MAAGPISTALVAARNAAAAATSIRASSPVSAGDMATRPIAGSSTTSPMVSTSKGAGSVNTTAPEATVTHTRASASLCVALRGIAIAAAGRSGRASVVMDVPP